MYDIKTTLRILAAKDWVANNKCEKAEEYNLKGEREEICSLHDYRLEDGERFCNFFQGIERVAIGIIYTIAELEPSDSDTEK